MDKNRTKKQFIAETNNNLTAEECKEYYDNFGKLASVFARSTWKYGSYWRLFFEDSKSQ